MTGGSSVSEDDVDDDALAAGGEESLWASESEAEGIEGRSDAATAVPLFDAGSLHTDGYIGDISVLDN